MKLLSFLIGGALGGRRKPQRPKALRAHSPISRGRSAKSYARGYMKRGTRGGR